MEQSSQIQKNKLGQNQFSITDAIEGWNLLFFQRNAKAIFKNSFNRQDKCLNIYLIQNIGKGPPGG